MSALFQHYGVRLITTYSNTQKVSALFLKFVRLITGVRCPPYYSLVSVLLQHSVHLIPTPELSALLQDTVRLNVGTRSSVQMWQQRILTAYWINSNFIYHLLLSQFKFLENESTRAYFWTLCLSNSLSKSKMSPHLWAYWMRVSGYDGGCMVHMPWR